MSLARVAVESDVVDSSTSAELDLASSSDASTAAPVVIVVPSGWPTTERASAS